MIHETRNYISYEELLSMPNDSCVYVNRCYLHWLVVKGQLLNTIDENVRSIISKYHELERMQQFVEDRKFFLSHYLMPSDEIRRIINTIGDTPSSKTAFVRTDVKLQELNERQNKIRREYAEKKNESKNNTPLIKTIF